MKASARDHEQWADSLGAWLLGALPEDEAASFAAHLRECPVCQEDDLSLQVAADALPASAPPLPAPPELKARIMAVVEREAQLLAAAGSEADRPQPAPRRRWRIGGLSLRPGLALAATCALLLGGVGALVGERALKDDVRTVPATLSSERASTGARAELRISEGGATLVGTKLPAPPKGRVYEVWLDRGGRNPEPTSALFSTRRDGSASVSVPGSLKGVREVLVTDEPEGGSSVPTREPLLTVSPS